MLKENDRPHLERFVGDVGFNGSVRAVERKEGIYCMVAVCSAQEWIADLARIYSITPRKTHTLQPPKLDNALHRLAYIAGYYDGDGHVTIDRKTGRVHLGVCGASKPVLEWIRNEFDARFPRGACYYRKRTLPNVRLKTGRTDFWMYTVTGARAVDIYSAVRALDVPVLERKWSKFEDLTNVNCRPDVRSILEVGEEAADSQLVAAS
jgi:hypothetical protein